MIPFIINLIKLMLCLCVCVTGVCRQGQIIISERDIDEACTSTCPLNNIGSIKHGCSFIDHCRIKESGWKHWFTRCTHCECDCFIPCSETQTQPYPLYFSDQLWCLFSPQYLFDFLFQRQRDRWFPPVLPSSCGWEIHPHKAQTQKYLQDYIIK